MLRSLQLLAFSALALLALIPSRLIENGPSLCLIKALFGRECYGCGMTRALSYWLHGDFAGAMALNCGAVVVLPILFALSASILFARTGHRNEAG